MFCKQSHWPNVMLSQVVVLSMTVVFSGQVAAQDNHPEKNQPPPKDHGWSGKLQIGLDSSVGNTNTRKIKVNGQAVHNKDFDEEKRFRHTLGFTMKKGDVAQSRGGDRRDTTDKESANYKVDYYLTERSSARAFGFYLSDKLAKIDSFTQVGVGYEHDIYKTPRHTVNLGGGISNVNLEYSDGTPSIEGPAGRVALSYNGKLTDSVSLDQKLVVLGMDGLTMKTSNTSLEYAFTAKSSVSLDHEVTNYSTIAQTAIDKTDSSTSLNLNFKF